jgi:hypothetical protein
LLLLEPSHFTSQLLIFCAGVWCSFLLQMLCGMCGRALARRCYRRASSSGAVGGRSISNANAKLQSSVGVPQFSVDNQSLHTNP